MRYKKAITKLWQEINENANLKYTMNLSMSEYTKLKSYNYINSFAGRYNMAQSQHL